MSVDVCLYMYMYMYVSHIFILEWFGSNGDSTHVHSLTHAWRNPQRLLQRQQQQHLNTCAFLLYATCICICICHTWSFSNACLANLYAPSCLLCFARVK